MKLERNNEPLPELKKKISVALRYMIRVQNAKNNMCALRKEYTVTVAFALNIEHHYVTPLTEADSISSTVAPPTNYFPSFLCMRTNRCECGVFSHQVKPFPVILLWSFKVFFFFLLLFSNIHPTWDVSILQIEWFLWYFRFNLKMINQN